MAEVQPALRFACADAVRVSGLLGEALDANHRGRLSTFIVDESSPAIALFHPDRVRANESGDWYGEHAGKWLAAAAKAAVRTNDAALRTRVLRVADYLIGLQGDEGYLGTYALERRFTQKQPPKPVSWDGAPALRTWDIWVHSYLMLGFIEVHRQFSTPRHLDAARRIAELCWRTLSGGNDITSLGNHHGLSATVLMDPALELHFATGERRYLDLALLVLEQAERNPQLKLLTQALAGVDASEIATGKAYQLLWNLLGLAKLHRATGDARYLAAVDAMWRNVRDHHLTLGGGPWGGVGHRSREVFNPSAVFSPIGYVETCSTFAWIELNRELLALTGDAKYAEEIERSAYNDLLGAQAPNGEDWCYYSFPNGRRVHTTYWRCCKSSGMAALEDLPSTFFALGSDGRIVVNLLGSSEAILHHATAGAVRLEQRTRYPFDGSIELRVLPERRSSFTVAVRVPGWAEQPDMRIDGAPVSAVPGEYALIEREWHAGDSIVINLPMAAKVHRRSQRNVQDSFSPEGEAVSQQVMRFDYCAITRGPLVYATDLIDGYKIEETLRLQLPAEQLIVEKSQTDQGPELSLYPVGRPAISFSPYYRAGGRHDQSWRLTWMSLAPE